MICAISPARDNIDETISTLRYANQAKMIQLQAIVNESETDKIIRELAQENERLKELLNQLRNQGNTVPNVEKEDLANQIVEMENHLNQAKHNDLFISKMELTKSQFTPKSRFKPKLITSPTIYNLNEDPLLSETIQYPMDQNPLILITRQS